jgi:formate/nitrite transporter FocA (FNT family)
MLAIKKIILLLSDTIFANWMICIAQYCLVF